LDRNSIHFYTNRADKIDQRIEEVKNQAKFVKLIKENYASKQGTETEELNWSIFKDLNQLLVFKYSFDLC
jgi:glucose-6-phosphate-specific signal transduction histidine kinase